MSLAQVNLVRNPSLEEYSTCPDNIDGIPYAKYWKSLDSSWSPPDWAHAPLGVPEYCNICAVSTSEFGIPGGSHIGAGHYYHFPRTGHGMAGVQVYYDETIPGTQQLRDYMQGHLINNLVSGQSYCVSFYVTMEQASVYAINHIGAYLDDGTIDTTHNYGLTQNQYTPHILSTSIINDTLNWIRIQGSFIADGTERIITIGNFSDKTHTSCVAVIDTTGIYTGIGGYSWYLVDDVSVIKSDAAAYAGTDAVLSTTVTDSVIIGDTLDSYLPTFWYANGVKIDSNKAWLKVRPDTTTRYVVGLLKCGGETSYDSVTIWASTTNNNGLQAYKSINAKIYPNPAKDKLTVENASSKLLLVYDLVGRLIFQLNLASNYETINIEQLSTGVYISEIVDPQTNEKKAIKFVKD